MKKIIASGSGGSPLFPSISRGPVLSPLSLSRSTSSESGVSLAAIEVIAPLRVRAHSAVGSAGPLGTVAGAEALASLRECLSRPTVETMDAWLSSRQRLILLEKRAHHIETSLEVIAEHASVGMACLLSDKDPAAKMEDFLDQILAVKEGHLQALKECLDEAEIDWEWEDVAEYCHLHSMLANGFDDLDPAEQLEIMTRLDEFDLFISDHDDVTIRGEVDALLHKMTHFLSGLALLRPEDSRGLPLSYDFIVGEDLQNLPIDTGHISDLLSEAASSRATLAPIRDLLRDNNMPEHNIGQWLDFLLSFQLFNDTISPLRIRVLTAPLVESSVASVKLKGSLVQTAYHAIPKDYKGIFPTLKVDKGVLPDGLAHPFHHAYLACPRFTSENGRWVRTYFQLGLGERLTYKSSSIGETVKAQDRQLEGQTQIPLDEMEVSFEKTPLSLHYRLLERAAMATGYGVKVGSTFKKIDSRELSGFDLSDRGVLNLKMALLGAAVDNFDSASRYFEDLTLLKANDPILKEAEAEVVRSRAEALFIYKALIQAPSAVPPNSVITIEAFLGLQPLAILGDARFRGAQVTLKELGAIK